jgi:predicted permease
MLREVSTVALSKLLLHPIAVFLWLLPMPDVEPKLQTAAVVFASVPMLSIFPILAHRYEQEGFAAAALLVATTLSFVTITLILSAMNAFMAIG